MRLRKLKQKDAELMLSWMHDSSVTKDLATNFATKTLEDAKNFIFSSTDESVNLHRAIVSDEDEYMGTVSLKCIDKEKLSAEFAITVRKESMQHGYSWFGMCEMLKIAFDELRLDAIYWCVSQNNERAVKFYEKHGFGRMMDVHKDVLERYPGRNDLIWYSVLKGDDYMNKAISSGQIAGCKIININTIPTVDAGELSFFEECKDVKFDIKRIYYISKVPEGMRRGYHAHKKLKQILFCPYGKILIILDDGKQRKEITLCDPSIGLVIDHSVWREMLWLQKDSVLCVAASEYYDENDYIRDYNEFVTYNSEK